MDNDKLKKDIKEVIKQYSGYYSISDRYFGERFFALCKTAVHMLDDVEKEKEPYEKKIDNMIDDIIQVLIKNQEGEMRGVVK